MDPITTWQFMIPGLGFANVYAYDWRYAGGFLYVGLENDGDSAELSVFNLGDSKVALGWATVDQDNKPYVFYWNLSKEMMLWLDGSIDSSSIGPDQTFTLENLGKGNIALSIGGTYLSGQKGGIYPNDWGFGDGEIILTNAPAPWQVVGDQVPILEITKSGYLLDLSNKSLGNLDLTGANMQQCILSGADLSQVTSLQEADFTDAKLNRQAKLNNQDLGKARTWLRAQFDNTDLTTIATAAGAHMEKATFSQAMLTNMHFKGAHLAGAVFHGATLDGADFTGADLSGADFSHAQSLKHTIFSGATMYGTIFNNTDLSSAVFDESPTFTRESTGRTQFQGTTVPFRVLNSDWSYLDLTDATITGIPHAIPKLVADQALLPDNLDLQNTDFTCSGGSGASFRGARMYGIQLQGANLQGAQLQGALLKSARLDGANLTLADLTAAWMIVETATPKTPVDQLEAASLIKAFMFNTVMDQAHCDGVDFTDAVFSTSILSTQPASAERAFLNDAKFNDAWVLGASFNGTQLAGANFANAHLIGSRFQNSGSVPAELTPSIRDGSDASIAQADISGTDFTGANMDGLDMVGAIVATEGDFFGKNFTGYHNASVPVTFTYGPTVFGNTTKNTTCPDGNSGPCKVT
jgi:uncharacterized protein YjbI with pentapeptide repeats